MPTRCLFNREPLCFAPSVRRMTFSLPNDNGEVEAIGLAGDHATDALLVHLKGIAQTAGTLAQQSQR